MDAKRKMFLWIACATLAPVAGWLFGYYGPEEVAGVVLGIAITLSWAAFSIVMACRAEELDE